MPQVKVTTLVENTVPAGLDPLIAEHGLAFFIETPENTILFDTGQGMAVASNAKLLGVDLGTFDTLVLSHAHFDHGGGLKSVLEHNNQFTLVAHPEVYATKFAGAKGQYAPIGIEHHMELIKDQQVTVEIGTEPFQIAPGVTSTGLIPMKTDFEVVEPMFFKDDDTNTKYPDLIEDDKALILETPKGIVVVLGCAHRGIINTLNYVTELTGEKKIHAIMGGLHLMYADPEKLKKVAEYFHNFNIDKFIIGHCTGFAATMALKNEFGQKVVPNHVGHVAEY